MHFRLRLIALESPGFPALDDHSSHRLDLPDTLTVSDFLKSLQLPEGRYGVLLNGRSLSAGERHRLLRSGDDLVIFPSIKGGQTH